MRVIIVILSALGAAIILLSLLKGWQRRRARQRSEIAPDQVLLFHLISVFFGFAVFFLGAFWIESSSVEPGAFYIPATLEGGAVKSGSLTKKFQ